MTRQASFSKEVREQATEHKETMFRIQFNGQYDNHKEAGSAIEMVGTKPHAQCLEAYQAFLKVIDRGTK